MKKIALRGIYGKGKFALVDDEDFDRLNKDKWHVTIDRSVKYTTKYYVLNGKNISIHRTITGFPFKKQIDHIDGDGLNNQKYNLRIVSNRINQNNWHKPKTSIYPGVYRHKPTGKWIARTKINGKSLHLGCFTAEIDAAKAYKMKLKEFKEVIRMVADENVQEEQKQEAPPEETPASEEQQEEKTEEKAEEPT